MLRSALLCSLVALLAVGLAPPAGAAPKRPGAVKLAKASLGGTSLSLTWKKTTGRVEAQVRTTVGQRTRFRITSATGKSGRLTTKVVGAKGAPLAPAAVRVKLRRCASAGKAKRCGKWSKSLTPRAPKVAGPVAPPAGPSGGTGPTVGSCPMLPAEHAFNQDVSGLPVDPRSAGYLASIGTSSFVHPDFGSADLGQGPGGFGIPYVVVPEAQPAVPIEFTDYGEESDPGPYPIPANAPIEGNNVSEEGDRHVLVVQEGTCKLYEMGRAFLQPGGSWTASGGAVWDLRTGAPRPPRWTSADAAGLPILPGLARYDEVAAGAINHALRFTVNTTQQAYIAPASHWASDSTDPNAPPMGLRLRMRADFDLSGFKGQALVVATALKRYGMIVADNGSDWYISGAPDSRWDDDDLGQLKQVPGSAFEVVQTGAVVRP